MTNKANSRRHGMHRVERRRPSATLRKRANKAANRVRQQERQQKIQEAIAAART